MHATSKMNVNQPLKKSQSLCSLQSNDNGNLLNYNKEKGFFGCRGGYSHTISDSSIDICVVNDSDSDVGGRNKPLADSGICERTFDSETLVNLEQKIDKLSDMFLEQCQLLSAMKEEIRSSKAVMEKTDSTHNEILTALVKKAVTQSSLKELNNQADYSGNAVETVNCRAKILLDAIECTPGATLDREIRETLSSFLQSDDLKERMVKATAESVKDVIGGCFSRDVSTLYLPILEQSHRRLVRHISVVVEEAFVEMEENSAILSKSVNKISKSLHRALDRHHGLLEAAADPGRNLDKTLQCAVEELLHVELKQWRQKVLEMFSSQLKPEPVVERAVSPKPTLDYEPVSPVQPADPETSIIDQLMKSAEINKQIQEGDINGSFEKALCAADLSLVMAACRAVDPASIFTSPCKLTQAVLLSLIQQLATDMVHDTSLKCRYLEEAIINLNTVSPETRIHLPLVIGEVRKHLTKFLSSYPSHVASRRITLIVMAANNLLR